MDTWFPTVRRLTGIELTLPFPWPRRATLAQRRALLRLILVAAEQNIPLAPLVEAWAADESGLQRPRLVRLAGLLRAGRSLPDALEEVRNVLDDDQVLAVRFGIQSGTLPATLRELTDQNDVFASVVLPRWRRTLFYVGLVVLVAYFIVTFLQIKIVPEFHKIMEEFNIPVPPSLQGVVVFARIFVSYWYLFALGVLALCWLVFTSWPGRRLRRSLLGRLFRSLNELRMADVLEQLSVSSRAGRPISGAISTLARYHYDPALRNRLLFIRNEIEQGADAWQSMGAVGLLTQAEVRVLRSAERVGNQPWALKQLAQHKRRQSAQRLNRRAELALPLVIVLLGGFVLFQALGIFGPMVSILHSLV